MFTHFRRREIPSKNASFVSLPCDYLAGSPEQPSRWLSQQNLAHQRTPSLLYLSHLISDKGLCLVCTISYLAEIFLYGRGSHTTSAKQMKHELARFVWFSGDSPPPPPHSFLHPSPNCFLLTSCSSNPTPYYSFLRLPPSPLTPPHTSPFSSPPSF